MRILKLIPAGLLLATAILDAHNVIYSANPMVLTKGGPDGTITIAPFPNESCIVQAFAGPPPGSNLISVTPQGGVDTAVQVVLLVHVLRAPNGPSESVNVSGNWSATGEPAGMDCTGYGAISVQVTVNAAGPPPSPPTGGNTPNELPAGEPVSTATGELFGFDERADLTTTGPLSLTFRRYYASYLSSNGVTSALGKNWMSNFDLSLAVSGSTAKATLFRGKTVSFKQSNGVWQLSSTEQRPYQLIAAGSGYQLLDPRSNRIYAFNSSGALTGIQDRNGNTLTATPGANGPTQVSDGLGRTLTLTYTGGNLTKVQDQAGRSVTFQTTASNLTSFTDANGKTTTFAYTSAGGFNGLMTSATLPNGNQPFVQTFDAQGRVATQSHALGATMTFTYNAATNGATTAEPGGPTLNYANDANFNLTSLTDSSGAGSKKTYDAANRVLTSTDRTGAVESILYDFASGLPATFTDPLGNKTTFRYSPSTSGGFTFYDLIGATFADGTSITYARDGKGNVTARTDQAGKTSQFVYNAAGEVTAATNPSGAVTKLAYGSDATLTSVQLPSGDTTTLAYDAAKRPNQLTNPDGTVVAARYDALDNLTGVTDERNDVTASSVDANDNLHSVTDALNAATTFVYDADDRLSSTTDALGRAITRTYDPTGRLQSVTDASGVSTSYIYDALNRPTQVLDAAGKGLTLAWDPEARLTSSTDALSRTTRFTRDARGMVTAIKTPKGETSSAVWDALRRPISGTDALGGVTTFRYEPRGLLSSLTLPGGVASAYTYNELGLLTSDSDPKGNVWNTAWDTQGRLMSRTDPLGQTTSRQYDSRQRLSTITFPQGTEQFTYDAVGNLTARTYSDGTKLNYTYDADNRLTAATGLALSYDANSRITGSNGLQIARDSAGRIASITYAPGKVVQYGYDNRGLLTKVTDWVGGTSTFTYDAAHQLVSRTLPNGVSESYTYDSDGRPTTIQANNGSTAISSIALTRDARGRVTGAVRSAPNVPDFATGFLGLAYDAASQSYSSTYDSFGRATQDAFAARTYTWDLASRLASYSGSNGSASFTYDAQGQRISATTGGVTQNFVLDYALPLPSVSTVQTGGADLRYYVWLPGGTLLESIEASGGARHFYHFDESGTTSFLTGDSGAVTDSYAGSPYGETLVQTGSTPNPFTFQGAFGVMQEGATGLYYMRARYFDSASARFLSRDPLASVDPRAINPYQFAYNKPVEQGDPSGRDTVKVDFFRYFAEGLGAKDPDETLQLKKDLAAVFDTVTASSANLTNVDLNNFEWGGPPKPFSLDTSHYGVYQDLDLEDIQLALDVSYTEFMEGNAQSAAPSVTTGGPPTIVAPAGNFSSGPSSPPVSAFAVSDQILALNLFYAQAYIEAFSGALEDAFEEAFFGPLKSHGGFGRISETAMPVRSSRLTEGFPFRP